jgi:hypothetical protein
LTFNKARKEKAARTKDRGSPIVLASKPIKIEVRGDSLWTAESGGLVRKYSLEVLVPQQVAVALTMFNPTNRQENYSKHSRVMQDLYHA